MIASFAKKQEYCIKGGINSAKKQSILLKEVLTPLKVVLIPLKMPFFAKGGTNSAKNSSLS